MSEKIVEVETISLSEPESGRHEKRSIRPRPARPLLSLPTLARSAIDVLVALTALCFLIFGILVYTYKGDNLAPRSRYCGFIYVAS